jgi:hypothetical protein
LSTILFRRKQLLEAYARASQSGYFTLCVEQVSHARLNYDAQVNQLTCKSDTLQIGSLSAVQESNTLSVYSDPASDLLHIEHFNSILNLVKVYDLQGELLYQKEMNESSLALDLSLLDTEGLILVEVVSGQTVFRIKISLM